MEKQMTKEQETPKVVNLFTARQQAAEASKTKEDESQLSSKPKDIAFDDAMRKNQENAERLRKERFKANQGVLKSYRIKN